MAGMHRLVTEKGWYDADSPKPQTARNLSISLNLEAAELLEHFQWTKEPKDLEAIGAELADVVMYAAQIANVLKIDLGAATMAKLEKNFKREWPR